MQTQRRAFNLGAQPIVLDTILQTEELLDALIAQGSEHPDYQDEVIPYWADLWPSALGLSQYLAEQLPEQLLDAKVLELGCGLGLPGIMASQLGAAVTFSDYVAAALDFARHNWLLNPKSRHTAQFWQLDWRQVAADPTYDLILAADVAYEARFFQPLYESIRKLLKPGGNCWLSEPGRAIAKNFIHGFAEAGFTIETACHYPVVRVDGLAQAVTVYKIYRSNG